MSWSIWIAESHFPSHKPNWTCVWITDLILPIRKSEDWKEDPGPHCFLGNQAFILSLWICRESDPTAVSGCLPWGPMSLIPQQVTCARPHAPGPGYTPTAYIDAEALNVRPPVSPDDSHTYRLHRALSENEL